MDPNQDNSGTLRINSEYAKDTADRTCVHCELDRRQHLEDKCLFEATSFFPMSQDQWAVYEIKNISRFGMFHTHETMGTGIGNIGSIQNIEFFYNAPKPIVQVETLLIKV